MSKVESPQKSPDETSSENAHPGMRECEFKKEPLESLQQEIAPTQTESTTTVEIESLSPSKNLCSSQVPDTTEVMRADSHTSSPIATDKSNICTSISNDSTNVMGDKALDHASSETCHIQNAKTKDKKEIGKGTLTDMSYTPFNFLIIISFTSAGFPNALESKFNNQSFGIAWDDIDATRKCVVGRKQIYILKDPKENIGKDCCVASLQEALTKFEQHIVFNYLSKRKSVGLVVTDVSKNLSNVIYKFAEDNKMKLANHFYRVFDMKKEWTSLCKEFKEETKQSEDYKQIDSFSAFHQEDQQDLEKSIELVEKLSKMVIFILQNGKTFCHYDKLSKTIIMDAVKLKQQNPLTKSLESNNAQNEHHVHIATVNSNNDDNDELGSSGTNIPKQFIMSNGTVIRLRGLPWTATKKDIRDFFSSYKLSDDEDAILIVTNIHGRATGEAYVEFASPQEAQKSFEMQKKSMMHRYIEIFGSSKYKMEYMKEIMRQDEELFGSSTVIRMRGIPFSATEDDLIQFFEKLCIDAQKPSKLQNNDESNVVKDEKQEVKIMSTSSAFAQGNEHDKSQSEAKTQGTKNNANPKILLVRESDGSSTGEAYAQFCSPEMAKQALKLNKEKIGNRYIELFRSSEEEMESIKMFLEAVNSYSEFGQNGRFSEHVVRLRGLPFSSDEMDIADFFSGLSIAREGIHLVFNYNNKPTGEAFVEFASAQDVEKAIERNKQRIKDRYIEIFKSSPKDFIMACNPYHDYTYNSSPYDAYPYANQLYLPQVPTHRMMTGMKSNFSSQQFMFPMQQIYFPSASDSQIIPNFGHSPPQQYDPNAYSPTYLYPVNHTSPNRDHYHQNSYHHYHHHHHHNNNNNHYNRHYNNHYHNNQYQNNNYHQNNINGNEINSKDNNQSKAKQRSDHHSQGNWKHNHLNYNNHHNSNSRHYQHRNKWNSTNNKGNRQDEEVQNTKTYADVVAKSSHSINQTIKTKQQ